MTDNNEAYRRFVIESIRLYRSLPALWDVKAKEYRNKLMKNEAYDIMVEKFREFYPDASREEVKKKFNILRTNYRKELKKLQLRGNDFVPSLWYFQELTFLNSSLHMEMDSCVVGTDIGEDIKPVFPKIPPDDEQVQYRPRELEESTSKYEPEECFPAYSGHSALKHEPVRNAFEGGEFQAVGFNVSAKLQKMSTDQQIYAELLLNKVLTRGLLGTLTAKTDITES